MELIFSLLATLMGKIDELFVYAVAHPHGTTAFILSMICLILFAVTTSLAYSQFRLDEAMGNAAVDTTKLDTQDAVFMVTVGAACLVLSIISVAWFLRASDIDIMKILLTEARYGVLRW